MPRPAVESPGLLRKIAGLGRHRPLLLLASAFVLAWLAAVGERAFARWNMERSEPARGACWIWADGLANGGEPATFWAVRDVRLDRADDVGLVLSVDEAYALWVNGVRIGGGVYAPGEPAHRYRLDDFVDAGWNRLAIEARSARGAGGILASLRVGDSESPRMVTDGGWWIVRRDHPAVVSGLPIPAELLEPPIVWGRGESGRWRPGPAIEDRPSELVTWPTPRKVRPQRIRYAHDTSDWAELSENAKRLPGEQVLYDFGREVEGFLELRVHRSRAGVAATENGAHPPALLYFGIDEPMPQEKRPDTVIQPFLVEGHWRDVVPRRFRYIALIGAPFLAELRVELTAAELAAELGAEPERDRGVFGLVPAKDYSPVEEEVWGRVGNKGVDTSQ